MSIHQEGPQLQKREKAIALLKDFLMDSYLKSASVRDYMTLSDKTPRAYAYISR